MALVKTVEMRVLAKAGDAQAKLDELAAKADEMDSKGIRMRFRVDSADANKQMDEVRAKADRLGFKDVSIKVKVDGKGRAIADLEAIKHEEDAVAGRGLLDKLIGGAGGGIPGGVGLPMLGQVPLPALAALVPVIGAIATELLGVVSGFAAAGAGAGAFYLLARPAIQNLQQDYAKLNTAQQAYQTAQEKAALSPTKANLQAEATALLNLRAARKDMTGDEGTAAAGVARLSGEYHKLTTAFQPQVFKVLGDGLKVIGNLLPHLAPFANTFAQGLDKLLQQAAKFTASKGFQQWLQQFHSLEGPAIASIGHGIGEVANAFGKLLTVMSGKDVAHALNIAFGAISGTINVVTFAIRRFMQNFDGMKSAATSAVDGVGHAFKGMVGTVESAVHGVLQAWHTMVSGIARGVSDAVHAVSELPGKIKGLFAGAAGWLVAAGRAIIEGLIHGIEAMLGPLAGVVSHVAGLVKSFAGLLGIHSPSTVMHDYGVNVVEGLVGGMRSQMPGLRGQVRDVTAAITGAAYGGARGYGYGGGDVHVHFSGVVGDPQAAARQVVQVLRSYKRTGGGVPLGIA